MSQDYYWTPEWQEGEKEALEQLEHGQSHVFKDAASAIHWLQSEDSSS